jgi:hypothetical protein
MRMAKRAMRRCRRAVKAMMGEIGCGVEAKGRDADCQVI